MSNYQLKLFSLLTCFFLTSMVFAQKKHALIFAIGNYPVKDGWTKINATNDAEYLKKALLYQGFLQDNIHVISDSMATKSGIIRHLVGLSNLVSQGDMVLIHFSCHGIQIENTEEKDGFDEAIVPYGAKYTSKAEDYYQQLGNYLIDKELGNLLQNISLKIGDRSEFLVTIDAGFSGLNSNNNVLEGMRGGYPPLKINENVKSGIPYPPSSAINTRSTVHIIQACRGNESAYEVQTESGKNIGILTYALANTLLNLSERSTYGNVFEKIREFVTERNPYQHPEASIASNRYFLGGLYNRGWPFIELNQLNKEFAIVASGRSKGITEGSEFEFYKAYQNNNSYSYLGRGIVTEASNFSCKVKLDSAIEWSAENVWAFLKNVNYGSSQVRLMVNDKKLKTAIELSSGKFEHLKLVEHNPELILAPVSITAEKSSNGITVDKVNNLEYQLINAENGLVYSNITNTENFNNFLEEKLKSYSIGSFLKILQNKTNGLSLDFNLIFIKDGIKDSIKNNKYSNSVQRVFYTSETAYPELENTGEKTVYVSVIDIQPDNKINMIFPNRLKGIMAEDLRIMPGQKLSLANYKLTMSPPFGRETFKIIISEYPIDLQDIINGGVKSTRGENLKFVALENCTIFDYVFEIQDAKLKDNLNIEYPSDFQLNLTKANNENAFKILLENDKLHLTAVNNTEVPLYYNVVSFDNEQNITVIFPNINYKAEDCKIINGSPYNSNNQINVPLSSGVKYFIFYSTVGFDLSTAFEKSENKQTLLSEILMSGKMPGRSFQNLNYKSYFYKILKSGISENPTKGSKMPVVEMLSPKLSQSVSKGATTIRLKAGYIDISGFASTEDQEPVQEVKVNGNSIVYNRNRQFFKCENFRLVEGNNRIKIEAISDDGQTVTEVLDVYLEPFSGKVQKGGKNYFVGIGINTYGCCGYDALNNSRKDVEDFARILENRFDFQKENIILLLDTQATRSNIYRTLRDFITNLDSNDNIVVYFSGHGNKDQIDVGGYFFIPTDIKKDNRGVVDESSLLSEHDILSPFKKYRARHSLLIVDACYSGLIAGDQNRDGGNKAAIEVLEKQPSKWILTSGRAEKVSDGKPGANSPFASTLINYFRNVAPETAIPISIIVKELMEKVPQQSNQTPMGKPFAGDGEFVFHCK